MRVKTDIHFAVAVDPAQVFDAVAAIELLPEWSLYSDARVASRDESGRPQRVYVTADTFLGRSDLQVLEYEWTADRVSWQVVDSCNGLGGGGWFEVSRDGADTQVWYHTEVHYSLLLPGLLLKRSVRRESETVVQNFIEFAEGFSAPPNSRAV
ncbi:SRPBCC family protein [Nocardia gipuzkoensis]|uniref:SRPBCC family protein n=1 Tax=Nocardia gipuzkoensis TaxID=2749991 RepID=UPI0015EFA811|nr:SRPBCC family protein [Nocardia gipuzkoensis]UGT69304.1 SRPBCC family protein [Nocardia gipuzkoensis]